MLRALMLALCCLGTAAAGCTLQRAQVHLPDYSALRTGAGSLSVTVACHAPTDEAVLELSGPSLRVQGRDLLLTLGRQGETLTLTAPDAAPLFAGVRIVGTQTLHFPLELPRDQWTTVGDYSLPLILSLRSPLP